MTRRQTLPRQWLILHGLDETALSSVRRLPLGSGILVVGQCSSLRRLRSLSRSRRLAIAVESRGDAARVHSIAELRSALLRGVPLILLSPIFPTSSHPGWLPIPRMRAAALARLAGRRLLALGGMDAQRYAAVAPLGFIGWAGMSAFRT